MPWQQALHLPFQCDRSEQDHTYYELVYLKHTEALRSCCWWDISYHTCPRSSNSWWLSVYCEPCERFDPPGSSVLVSTVIWFQCEWQQCQTRCCRVQLCCGRLDYNSSAHTQETLCSQSCVPLLSIAPLFFHFFLNSPLSRRVSPPFPPDFFLSFIVFFLPSFTFSSFLHSFFTSVIFFFHCTPAPHTHTHTHTHSLPLSLSPSLCLSLFFSLSESQ